MSVDLLLVVIGGALLAIGLPSNVIKRVWLTVSLIAVLAGVALGPAALGVLEPAALGDERKVLEELARITLAVSLVGAGLQFGRSDLFANARRGAALLTAGMAGMWLSTSFAAWLLLDVEVWVALLIGGILTPTDPVVASSLVTGRLATANLPRWLRRTLQLESGANDGLALVFVLVPALVLSASGGSALAIAGEVARQLAVAALGGVVLGLVTARLVDFAEDHEAASEGFFLASALGLALLTLGAVHALGGSGVLASFVAGVTFSLVLGDRYQEELERMQDALLKLLVVPVFLLFGATLPWDGWVALGWPGLAFAAWVVLLRRPLAVAGALALVARDTPRRGVAFLSFYGPVGVSGIFYVLFVERFDLAGYERIHAAGTLAIAVAVVAFSVAATPGVRRYAGRRATTTLRHPLTDGIDGAP